MLFFKFRLSYLRNVLTILHFLMKKSGAVAAVFVWDLDLPLSMQSVPITTNVASSNPTQARFSRCDQICQWQVGSFLRVLRFPPLIKLAETI